jgi:hypothetical protein
VRRRFCNLPAFTLLASVTIAQAAQAQTQTAPAATAPRFPQTFVVLVGGLPGSPIYARRYQDWLTRFHTLLTKNNVPAANISILTGDKEFKAPIVTGPASVESITASIAAFSKNIRAEDQFILVIVGHGSRSDSKPTLVLPGADLDPETLAKTLPAVSAENQVILNFSGTGGDFLKSLANKNRVNITATLPEENADPVFPEFFLRALESNRADGEGAPAAGAKNGATTLLEAYNWSAHQTALWITRQVGNKDGTWTVNGKESVEIFKKLFDGPDTRATTGGMRTDGSRKLSAESDAMKPDEPVTLVVPPDLKPNAAEEWAGRRVVNEHAQLEDAGLEDSISALRGEKGYDPIPIGKRGEQGARAARVIFGKPAFLQAPEK